MTTNHAKQLFLMFSCFSAAYMPHSDVVVIYKNGNMIGGIEWSDKHLFIMRGAREDCDFVAVAQRYMLNHPSQPLNEESI
jgi:hypothetical protein